MRFLRENAEDAAIGVMTVAVDPAGTELTADITIAAEAPVGARVVRVTTDAGASTPAVTNNVFTVE